MNKTLIFGTMYLYNQEMVDIVKLWIDRVSSLGRDWLLIDSNSPKDLVDQLEIPKANLFTYKNNIGHLSKGGCDGWGRAFCRGIDFAILNNYENVVHIESDLLVAKKAFQKELCAFEIQNTNKVQAPICVNIQTVNTPQGLVRSPKALEMVETGLMLFKTAWAKEVNLVDKYDWTKVDRFPRPETRIKEICKDVLVWFWVNKGKRLEGDATTDGLLYITHSSYGVLFDFFRNTND